MQLCDQRRTCLSHSVIHVVFNGKEALCSPRRIIPAAIHCQRFDDSVEVLTVLCVIEWCGRERTREGPRVRAQEKRVLMWRPRDEYERVPESIRSADVVVLALSRAEQHSRLLEIASRYPVNCTLTSENQHPAELSTAAPLARESLGRQRQENTGTGSKTAGGHPLRTSIALSVCRYPRAAH
jgi:hypothetical protein